MNGTSYTPYTVVIRSGFDYENLVLKEPGISYGDKGVVNG
jgi:hypothetical protein